MLDFMDLVQNAFHNATQWNVDNSYSTLNSSARGLSFPFLSAAHTLTIGLHSLARLPYAAGATNASLLTINTSFRDLLHAW
jgi:distribution and morphology protein 10